MIGVNKSTTVYEPTAGHGALVMSASPKKVTANEIDPVRLNSLNEMGFSSVTAQDARDYTPDVRFDRIIANPPFGGLKPVKMVSGFKISKLEHLIAIRALNAMQDDGAAAFILGAGKFEGETGAADKVFLNYLMNNYYVTGNFEVSGDLYRAQGASFPLRVVTIHGKREQGLGKQKLAPNSTERLTTWQSVWEKISEVKNEAERERSNLDAGGQQSVADGW